MGSDEQRPRVPVVTIRALRIGDVVHRKNGQGSGWVTRHTVFGDKVARVMWGTDKEEEVPVGDLLVEIDEDEAAELTSATKGDGT